MFRTPSATLSLVIGFALAACGQPASIAPKETATDTTEPVMIYTGGPIYTALDAAPTVDAVAVADGVILATGSRALVTEAAGDNARIIDLAGAAMYPGFTDAHAHLLGIGLRELVLNLENVGSVAELVSNIEEQAKAISDGDTIYGRGWIETGWPEGRMPTRDDLDPVTGGAPVVLVRADGHALVANSAALEAVGIDATTPDPEGGKIERDDTGRATGILIDAAMALVQSLVAAPTVEKKRAAYAVASDVYAAYGWTGVHNMSVSAANIPIMEARSQEGALDIRVYNSVVPQDLDWLIASGHRQTHNRRIVTRAVKLYIDGALGSRGALLTKPYSDRPQSRGLPLMDKPFAMDHYNRAIAADIQVATHAIGDEGNTRLLDWYEETFAAHPEARDLRWRDEHTQILHTEDMPRFAELGVIPSMQPSHAIGDLFFAPDRLGPDRLDGAYAWRSLIDAGAIIAGGSDAPVERGDPRVEFFAAVARRGLNGYSDENWRPEEAVTRAEALKMFTVWPAFTSFQEDSLGTIEPGKRADFTVFSRDIMTIPEDDILTVETVMTIIDGDIVFRADQSQ